MRRIRPIHQHQLGETAPVPTWPKSAVRISFGVIWGIDAAFKWKLGFHKEFLSLVKESGEGQRAGCTGGSSSGPTRSRRTHTCGRTRSPRSRR